MMTYNVNGRNLTLETTVEAKSTCQNPMDTTTEATTTTQATTTTEESISTEGFQKFSEKTKTFLRAFVEPLKFLQYCQF